MSGNYYCCVCGKPATVCKKETINGVTKVSYYCDECFALVEKGNSFDNLLSAMFNIGGGNIQKPKMRVCTCGMTEREILNSGKFGCSECYNLFRDIAENYVNTRGYLSHKGKKPAKNGTQTEKTNVNLKNNNNAKSEMSKIDKLKAELALAVKEERFLDCDKIAKQIAALQKEEK